MLADGKPVSLAVFEARSKPASCTRNARWAAAAVSGATSNLDEIPVLVQLRLSVSSKPDSVAGERAMILHYEA